MANISNQYKHQISLLLRILPEVAKEKSFALHGGTAKGVYCIVMKHGIIY